MILLFFLRIYSKSGLMTILVEQLKERGDEKVRRRLIAALGELLFYAATQEEDGVSLIAIHTR